MAGVLGIREEHRRPVRDMSPSVLDPAATAVCIGPVFADHDAAHSDWSAPAAGAAPDVPAVSVVPSRPARTYPSGRTTELWTPPLFPVLESTPTEWRSTAPRAAGDASR